MEMHEWVATTKELLLKFHSMEFSYPLGVNAVLPNQPSTVVDRSLNEVALSHATQLREFYNCCDGVSLPDVHVGYFIKSTSKLVIVRPDSEPSRITGKFASDVLTIGSTGGGDLFVMRKRELDILVLPPGPLKGCVYDDRLDKVRCVANDLASFLERLLSDVSAVVRRDSRHMFIT